MKIKEHASKILVFIINSLLIVVTVLIIKDRDKDRVYFESEDEIEVTPVSSDILNMQNTIAINRENELRSLNNSPKSIKQQKITTTTTTVTPSSNSSDRTTKTS